MKTITRDEIKLLVAVTVSLLPWIAISAIVHVKEHKKRKRLNSLAMGRHFKKSTTELDKARLGQEFDDLIRG